MKRNGFISFGKIFLFIIIGYVLWLGYFFYKSFVQMDEMYKGVYEKNIDINYRVSKIVEIKEEQNYQEELEKERLEKEKIEAEKIKIEKSEMEEIEIDEEKIIEPIKEDTQDQKLKKFLQNK